MRDGLGHDAAVALPPWHTLLMAFSLSFAAAMLALPLRVGGLTVFWPAAGVVAGLLLVSRRRGMALAGASAALGLASILGGRSADMVAVFLLANIVQALAFTGVLERAVGRPFQLDSLPAVACFVGCSVALPALVAWALAVGLRATGRVQGPLPDVWFTLFSSHTIGILTVAPAVLAVGRGPAALGVSVRERLRALGLLAAFSAGALLLIGFGPAEDDRVLIGAFALLYPFALWLAGRTSPAWCALALVALALVVIGCTVAGVGLFAGHVSLAQLFLVVGASWMLTLGLVLERQRVALRRAVASEAALRDSLRAGGAFGFDWCAQTDVVVRDGQEAILQAPAVSTGRAFFESVHPEDRAAFESVAFGMRPHEPTYLATYRYRRGDGSVVWLEERGRGEFDAEGRITRLQGITVDVTARKEAEAALREADRRKDEFIATLAHELRNPLAPIRTGLEVLGLARDDLPARERAVTIMKRQVGHIVRLVDDLLDVSRLATGKLVLQREPLPLAGVLADAVEDVTPLARSLGHRIDLDLDAGPLRVDGDRARLMQVAVNLLNNALRYTPPGGRILLQLARDGDEAVLRVRDSGIGIPPDKLETVFDLFVQVHGERGFQSGGLGIGLHLTRRLVLLHGGSIAVASAGAMQGSEFTVRLPLLAQPAGSAPAAPAAPAGARRRVLIVDDLPDSADSLAMLLAMHGHAVEAVHSGEAALARLDAFDPQVALVDIGMPGISGLDVARAIRARRPHGAPLLVAVSGWGREEDRRRSREAGFDAHLAKPVDLDELMALMARGVAAPA